MEPSDYALEHLRQDDQFILYRGRSVGADPTQILMLGPASAHPRPDTLRRIDHEYSLRAELDTAWTAQPLAPSHYNGQPDCEPERATPLAQLIHDKTTGNPFFSIQFFPELAEEDYSPSIMTKGDGLGT